MAKIGEALAPKTYCYVDETGQDTKGAYFLVSIVVVSENRDELLAELEAIERKRTP